jgi:hypothetical protein
MVAIAAQVALFAGAAWLALQTLRRRGPWTHLVGPAIVFYHQLAYAVVFVSPRYNVTVGPVLAGAFAVAILVSAGKPSAQKA